jgi:hypothetical protein
VIKSRRMSWMAHVGERRVEVCTGFRWGNLSKRTHLEGVGVGRMIMLKLIFMQQQLPPPPHTDTHTHTHTHTHITSLLN